MAACVSVGITLLSPATARAGAIGTDAWSLALADPTSVPQARRLSAAPRPDALPDGELATHSSGDIREAWYTKPTGRYGHGILGDAIEAGALTVRTAGGNIVSLKLPDTEVFEDRTPHLADLDDDGAIEVITIRSSTRLGAAVTIYGLSASGDLTKKATTDFIGRSNRWLNIAAIDSFAGNGRLQIAYVETPHIGGTLHLYDYTGGKLVHLASDFGFSNHAIGSRDMDLALSIDLTGADARPALILPDATRRALKIMAYEDRAWNLEAELALPHPVSTALGVMGSSLTVRAFFRLSDGNDYVVSRR